MPGAACVPRRGGVWKDSEALAEQGRQQEKGTQNRFSSLGTLTCLSHTEKSWEHGGRLLFVNITHILDGFYNVRKRGPKTYQKISFQ